MCRIGLDAGHSFCSERRCGLGSRVATDCRAKCLDTRGAWEGGSSDCTPADHDLWLADLKHWRGERLIRIGYNDSRYDLPALKWTQSSFMQPQMMVQDRYFYDPVAHRYTVDRYLDDL